MFRPGYIYPAFERQTPYWSDTLMKPLRPFRSTFAKWITDSGEVARAVLHCGTGGAVPSPATNKEIATAAAEYVEARTAAVN